MENTNQIPEIFKGTFLEEVLNFSGEIPEITRDPDRKLMGETEIGSMNQLEKTLYALASQKKAQREAIVEAVCRKHPDKITDEEIEMYQNIFDKQATPEQKSEHARLNKQEKQTWKIMWNLIKIRISGASDMPTIGIRPGYKIVMGVDVEDMLEGLFGGGIAGMVIKVGSL